MQALACSQASLDCDRAQGPEHSDGSSRYGLDKQRATRAPLTLAHQRGSMAGCRQVLRGDALTHVLPVWMFLGLSTSEAESWSWETRADR